MKFEDKGITATHFRNQVALIKRFILSSLLIFPAASCLAQETIDLVKVDKSARTLSITSRGKEVAKFHVVLGGSPVGHKHREGDERTPEGRYVLDQRNATSRFFRSLHVSYPNEVDKERARAAGLNPGGDIMIHGQKNGLGWLSRLSQRRDWTDGCIALSNKDMQVVWDRVRVPTPIEISP